jgi:hypothetical protein
VNVAMFCGEPYRLPDALAPHMPEIRAAERISIEQFGSLGNFRSYMACRAERQLEDLFKTGPNSCPAALSIFDRLPPEPGPGALAAFAAGPDAPVLLEQGSRPTCSSRIHTSD